MEASLHATITRLEAMLPGELTPQIVADLTLRAARGLIERGELDQAALLLAEVPAELSSGIGDAWLSLARAYAARSDGSAAVVEATFTRARLLEPVRGSLLYAQYLQRHERWREAIDAWKMVIETAPTEAVAHLGLARAFEQLRQPEAALAACVALIDAAPSMRNYLLVAQQLARLAPLLPPASANRAIRIALLGNATLDHLHSYVLVECFRAGLRPNVYQAGFDQYNQEILDPASGLYTFGADVIVCAIHASRLFATLHHYPFDATVADRHAKIEDGLRTLQRLLDTLSQHTSALILVHNMVSPQQPVLGILDSRDEFGQVAAFTEINARLSEIVRKRYRGVYVVDEDRLQGQCGKQTATDPRLWLTGRMPWSDRVLSALAREYLRYIRPLRGLNRKCIVVDLDNTLWGGVLGEDGIQGLQLGSEAPGNAFVAFQRELERLWRRGVLLAVCSKNNSREAQAAIEQHPDMVLRPAHFAALRINWQSKATNLREIASELNIGLDSLVFLDDNPVERAKVRAELPQVLTPDLPRDPAQYRAALLHLGVFDTLAFTEEDRQRQRLYAAQKVRRANEARLVEGGSVDEYLADLQMVVEIEPANSLTLARMAQLTTKTNQFNLTTRRYSEADIADRIAQGWLALGARVTDRFGDNGLTGVLLARPGDASWEIDTLLLSCRVMGRRVETAMIAFVAETAARSGIRRLVGWYLPTEKNAPAADCYANHGFNCVERHADGAERWELELPANSLAVPDWLTVRTLAAAA